MLRRSIICLGMLLSLIMLCISLPNVLAENPTPYASDDIVSASVSISSSKMVTYTLFGTRADTAIKVNYCYLYKKNSNGDWAFQSSMTKALPSDCTSSMIESCDASSYITESGTYRVKASFTAGNSTVTRTSNERTFD